MLSNVSPLPIIQSCERQWLSDYRMSEVLGPEGISEDLEVGDLSPIPLMLKVGATGILCTRLVVQTWFIMPL